MEVHPYKNTQDLIHDVFLSNYWDKRHGHSLLIKWDQFVAWNQYFYDYKLNNVHYIQNNFKSSKSRPKYRNICRKVTKYYNTKSSENNDIFTRLPNPLERQVIIDKIYNTAVWKILELANQVSSKLSLCGGAITNLLVGNNYADYDFFFHCDSVAEANNILQLCLEYIQNTYSSVYYYRSQGVITAHFTGGRREHRQFQFIKRNYETKDQILLGFDMAGCRYGYNNIDGFFTTIDGAIASAIDAFPLDLTQRSLSYGFRMDKYLNKGFKILLPGIPADKSIYRIETPDGIIKRSKAGWYQFIYNQIHKSDYDNNSVFLNWWFMAQDQERYHNVTFEAATYEDCLKLPDALIDTLTFDRLFNTLPSNMAGLLSESAKLFMGPDYEEFAKVFNIDFEKGDEMWTTRQSYYREKMKEIAKFINQEEQLWRHVDPGGQNFGKFDPIIEDPRKWYGSCYQPVVVGISNDHYQAFKDCCKNDEIMILLPFDVIKLICEYWLSAEVYNARARLFACQ